MREIDSMGKRCPQPIIDLARAMKNYGEEKEFTLLSDDPATMSDLTAWARMTRHRVTQIGESKFLIVRGIQPIDVADKCLEISPEDSLP